MQKKYILIFVSLLIGFKSFSQDIYTGTWQFVYRAGENDSAINMTLQIGSPERNLLYPARMRLQYDSFTAVYHLLLVKKNGRQLGISKNKAAIEEVPFSLGNWTVMLNGTFDFSKDLKNNSILTINRIPAKKYGIPMPDPSSYGDANAVSAIRLRDFCKDVNIQLKKINNDTWLDQGAYDVLHNDHSGHYFGLLDTIFVEGKDGTLRFGDNKDNDIITVQLNGKNIVDQVDSKKKRPAEEFILDTGINIISFFADDFGKNAPSTAVVHLDFETKKQMMSFETPADVAATFIVARVFYKYDDSNDTRFQTGEWQATNNVSQDKNSNNTRNTGDTSLMRNSKMLGNIISKSRKITLALWDDAVEDGDSISLSINGKWITQGFPVKKRPQFIEVMLEPGPNTITFIADNLGSIIPNTSVLEIIDGKRRKSFMIEADLNLNNQVKIYYDYKPDP